MSAVLLAMAYDALTPMANKKKPNFLIIITPVDRQTITDYDGAPSHTRHPIAIASEASRLAEALFHACLVKLHTGWLAKLHAIDIVAFANKGAIGSTGLGTKRQGDTGGKQESSKLFRHMNLSI